MQKYQGHIQDLALAPKETIILSGLGLSPLASVLSQLIRQKPQSIFVALPTALEAEDLIGDLHFFWPEGKKSTYLLPAFEAKPFMPQSTALETVASRLSALSQLASKNVPQIIVANAAALLRQVPPPASMGQRLLKISVGDELEPELLKDFLAANGYVAVGQVEARGDFSARGGLVDFFPPGAEKPLRVEFFGDLIESIRNFRIHDQRSVDKIPSVEILPVAEFAFDEKVWQQASQKLKVLAQKNKWPDLLWRPLAEKLSLGQSFSGQESWAPLLAEKFCPISDYLQQSSLLLYEAARFYETAEAAYLNLANHFDRLAQEERPHLPLETLFQDPEELIEGLKENSLSRWEAGELLLLTEQEKNAKAWQLPFENHNDLSINNEFKRSGAGLLAPLVARLKSLLGRGFKINLVLRTEEQVRRLSEMLLEYDLSPQKNLKKELTNLGQLHLKVGQLSKGFAANFDQMAYIAEDEIFGRKQRRRRRSTEEAKGLNFASLKDLSPGDFVVHNSHGIGQYLGLVTLTLSTGQKGDFLHLSYKGGDKLYVPVERFGAVSKYVGAGDGQPSLDKLGGITWEKLKGKVKENIRQMAEELLRLYAQREITPGFTFSEKGSLFREFEAAFEFDETPGQLEAIEAVLADLAAPKPMDRLICGDVGYGKTEVAMRAAFKVVEDKKQVAVLVPTTILAEQHEQSFAQRLAPWPIKVASLSRFKKPAEQKEILKQAAAGQVDIVIGTHRLLQKDVKFQDLGLVVIDEEHRFGVSDKEKLKKLRASIDVLSMSATPIPRSLSMALSGIRDLSSIETPPQDRLAVETTLLKYEDEALCEAIDRELARGGQVYLIHNRVRDINLWAAKLRKLMPLVKFGVGHGQMKEKELEEMMEAFHTHQIDVWITTTIVESGLDFPRANTIIIDQADRFGLAQLYQLRGRVGRGKLQAYAYLMVDNPDTLTSDAKKRLKALLDHSELGSGYQIAMHDLQIRGSGNILGAAQSGQASLVGYEMYAQLMEEAIRELKGEPPEEDIEPEIVMNLAAYLPADYAPDTEARLGLYRRLSAAKEVAEIKEVALEIKDRFGNLPPETLNLIDLMELKIWLKKARVYRLESGEGGLTLSFGPQGPANYDKVMALITNKSRQVRLSPNGKMFVGDLKLKTHEDLAKIKTNLLELL